jgi:hypothetical protein
LVGENRCQDILTFEVVDCDISYNCILGRSFLIKFMTVIHSTYALMKMSGPKGLILIPSDIKDVLIYDVKSLAISRCLRKELAAIAVAKVQRTSTPNPPTAQPRALNKTVSVDPMDPNKVLNLGNVLDDKLELELITFLQDQVDAFS